MPPSRGPPVDSHKRPGTALAAALSAAVEQELMKEAKPRRAPQSKVADVDDGATTERSSLPAMLRRVEQRVEADRRNFDRRMERLERRIEEVACASSAEGRWAELQGHVEGLDKTVQDLVRQCQGTCLPAAAAAAACGAQKSPRSAGQSDTALTEAVSLRVSTLESRMSHLEALDGQVCALRSLANELSGQTDELGSKLLQLGTRLMQAEKGLEGMSNLRDLPEEARAAAKPADLGELQGLNEQLEFFSARLQRVEQAAEATASAEDFRRLQQEVVGDDLASVSGMERPQDTEELRDQLREALDQIDMLRCDLEEHTAALQDQVVELSSRCQEMDHELQDVAVAQEARQEVDTAGERALRLALRAQRAFQAGQGFSDAAQDIREELTIVGEDLTAVWARVEGAERGLQGMAEALNRVCEELSSCQRVGSGRPSSPSPDPAAEQRRPSTGLGKAMVQQCQAGRQVQGKELLWGDRQSHETSEEQEAEAPALRAKVQELERSLESMAEVVWDLRKQVTGLRGRAAGTAEAEHPGNGEFRDS
eukprot:TRINITY_DN36008_c0_g1_i1.p1 TRINITY_DN36008_c0_g1~~TRINITY_DN36008_c0_g1_i1.p1  ORF type:complete len:539 (-),score=170.77 TRINITY_DN36008_c0_g1_i1:3-1619(-)